MGLRIFRHLFATLHVRWLSHISNRNACIYQTATRWDFPPYRITIWLIDDVKFVLVCLLDHLILGFCYCNLDVRNRWTRTRIDYHPCITSDLFTLILPILPNSLKNHASLLLWCQESHYIEWKMAEGVVSLII